MYLIDTNCLSEVTRVRPDENVVNWFTSHDESTMYLSVITVGELVKGITRLPDSAKKVNLTQWIKNDLESRFRHRILTIDERVASEWGRLQAQMESDGCPIPAVDALIAATCIVHNLILVTRNISKTVCYPIVDTDRCQCYCKLHYLQDSAKRCQQGDETNQIQSNRSTSCCGSHSAACGRGNGLTFNFFSKQYEKSTKSQRAFQSGYERSGTKVPEF